MKKSSSYISLFDFLTQKEKDKENFSSQEMANYLKIKKETAQKYINEKLKKYLITEKNSKGLLIYYSKGIILLTLNDFLKIMSQGYKIKESTELEVFYGRLIEKSFDAFTLALETYNRPMLKNKVEAFVILIVNAWETLLKAKIIKDANNKDIIYVDKKTFSGDKFTISIYDSINLVYKESSIIKSNLLEIIHLRDKATHLLIEELRPCLSQLFQANIINYIESYEFNFSKIPLLNNSPGMLTLVIPGENETKEIKAIYGEKTYIEVENFLKSLRKIENELNSDNFMCKVSYIAYLEKKKETKANITLINGSEAIDTQLVNIMNNPFNVYKYKFSDIVKKIKTDYDKFNNNIMILFIKKNSIKGNKEYHILLEGVERYSEKLINFINQEILNDHDFFNNIKSKK